MAEIKCSPLIMIRKYLIADETPLGVKHIIPFSMTLKEVLTVGTSELSGLKEECSSEEMLQMGQDACARLNELAEKTGSGDTFALK